MQRRGVGNTAKLESDKADDDGWGNAMYARIDGGSLYNRPGCVWMDPGTYHKL